ncbi:MAG: GAF domain-containing protein [Cytophagales bacterium]|nr:MAG: GAF domain-containing protein [Cytophagales bacterium]
MLATNSQLLYDGNNSSLYFQGTAENRSAFIVKMVKSNLPRAAEASLIANEFSITELLSNVKGVRKVVGKENIDGYAAILLEYVHGSTLKDHFVKQAQPLATFLKVAIQIADVLSQIHQHNVVHKDINVNNIIYNPDLEEIKIIDFGISSKLNLKKRYLGNPEKLEGTLAYIAPEQTGRMNRAIDHRSDLYSLGVTFYEMLTGKLPFDANDPMELVHCHIAKIPLSPSDINREIPLVVSQIVQKLLAKNAEARYQSALGLKNDLEAVLKSILSKVELPTDFAVGQMDFSAKFQIPQKLYGRDNEIADLLLAYERASQGTAEVLLVGGASGIGKSQLVHEIHTAVTAKRGWFIEGKFEQFQKNVPYKAWIQAFEEFVNLLLTENTETLEHWKNKIIGIANDNGKLLTDLVPHLELVIGKQAEVSDDLAASEAQSRLNYLILKFLGLITTPEHPLVIFLDDLQWTDAASLDLLEFLLINKDVGYLLIICAYRDQEVSPSHPFMMTVEELTKARVHLNRLQIQPLSQGNVNELLADTLNSSMNYVMPLADLIYKKTQGNAFFVNQFIQTLYEQELLKLSMSQTAYGQKVQWEWDTYDIEQMNFTDNVVELLVGKVQKLPKVTQKVLKLAACVGNRFDLQKLVLVSNESHEQIHEDLEKAVVENLILPTDSDNYKFAHDRVQQAVYSIIPEEEKKSIHLSIGQVLINTLNEEEKEIELFEIVNQMNLGLELIDKQEKRKALAQLNLQAGLKASDAAAYSTTFDYLQTAISLLEPNSWKSDYLLSYQIYQNAAQAAFQSSKFDDANAIGAKILENAKTLAEKSAVYEIQLQALLAQNKPAKMLDLGIEILKEFKVTLPRKASNVAIIQSLLSLKFAIRGKTPESFATLPPMTDETAKALIRLYAYIGNAAYFAEPPLLSIIIFNQVKLAAKYGNTEDAIYAYVSYGLLLCGVLNDIETGYRFGQMAEKLLVQMKAKKVEMKTYFVLHYFINHWKQPVHLSAKGLENAYKKSIEYSEPLYVSYCLTLAIRVHLLTGKYLPDLLKQVVESEQICAQVKQEQAQQFCLVAKQVVANLMEDATYPARLQGEYYDVETTKQSREEAKDQAMEFTINFDEMYLSFIFGDIDYALGKSEMITAELGSAMGSSFLYAFHCLDSLILLQKIESKEKLNGKIFKRIKNNQKKLQNWSKYSPNNSLHKYHLVEAELARVELQSEKAKKHYDKAISFAYEHQYINDEAIAWELAGKFYMNLGESYLATFYLQNAVRCYEKWGALAKVKQLETKYPQIRQLITKTPTVVNKTISLSKGTTVSSATITRSTQGTMTMSFILDMRSIIKASQTLSGEVVLSKLVEKMLQIVMENAGAEFAVLLQRGETSQFQVIAESHGIGDYNFLTPILLEKYDKIATSIVNYVIRTKEPVVLNNAAEDKKFSTDTYIKANKPKSVLCFPFSYKGRIAGIFYLENNLAEGVFTADRLEVLRLLSAQISISLENALLYENLEEKVRERTQKLNERNEEVKAQAEILTSTNKELDSKNQAITASINYAQRIQSAMLPLDEDFKKYFSEYFVFFRPRDIVSGDFYWLREKNGKVIVAAVDCTGHGVPGAFMSLISEAKLDEVVNTNEVITADEVLNQLNIGIKASLQQEETNNRDGMDMALCIIDKQAKTMEYAGAGNPLIYVQNDDEDNPKLHYIKADIYPIGGFNKSMAHDFKKHLIDISTPTTFYIFSDGFQDQFGGSEKRKFMTKRFRELLFELHSKPMDVQKQLIGETLESWMAEGNSPQIDDILVMGFRVGG